jgi:hypothetical protein
MIQQIEGRAAEYLLVQIMKRNMNVSAERKAYAKR